MRILLMILLLGVCHITKAANPYSVQALHPYPSNDELNHLRLQTRIAQMRAFVKLSVKDYERLRGKKLNFIERFSFKTSQRRMKMMLRSYDDGDVTVLEKISWLLKGFVFGPLAVLAAYIFLEDERRELIKWAWFGFAGFAVVLTLFLLAF